MLNVRYLAVFRAVAKAGSISAAASAINVSQPAVTKTIRLLEETLGITLFLRVKGRLIITPEAEQLMPDVERIFGNVKMVVARAEELRQGYSGSLGIACVTTLSTSLVAQTIERFHVLYPKVRVDIEALSTLNAINHIFTGHADIAVLDAHVAGFEMGVLDLCRSQMGCVMRRDHPLSRYHSLGPKELAGETLISFNEETMTGVHLRQAFEAENLSNRVRFTVNHTSTAYALVEARVGIAIVDSFPLVNGKYPDLVIRPFLPILETRPNVVFSDERAIPVVARKFVDELIRASNELINMPDLLIKAA